MFVNPPIRMPLVEHIEALFAHDLNTIILKRSGFFFGVGETEEIEKRQEKFCCGHGISVVPLNSRFKTTHYSRLLSE